MAENNKTRRELMMDLFEKSLERLETMVEPEAIEVADSFPSAALGQTGPGYDLALAVGFMLNVWLEQEEQVRRAHGANMTLAEYALRTALELSK